MNNSNKNSRMNPVLIKAFSLCAMIMLCSLVMIGLQLLPATPTIEILATMVAVLVAGISLYYVYLEHVATIDEEYQLAQALTDEIYADSPNTLSKHIIREGIQNVLSTQPNHLLRIQALQHYKKDRLALDQLILAQIKDQQEIDVLADFGLSWCPNNLSAFPPPRNLR
jgi:hypothetical protein